MHTFQLDRAKKEGELELLFRVGSHGEASSPLVFRVLLYILLFPLSFSPNSSSPSERDRPSEKLVDGERNLARERNEQAGRAMGREAEGKSGNLNDGRGNEK